MTDAMRTQVLDVERYREIKFVSMSVTPRKGGFTIVGGLTMVGRTRDVQADVNVKISSDTLRAAATFAVKQTVFGIKPYRGGPAGTVRVADRVVFEIDAVAIREPPR